MPSLKIIRKRISSVKSTQKITRAMKMVAGARLSRAQERIVALRPYALKTQEMLRDVGRFMRGAAEDAATREGPGEAEDLLHPLLKERPESHVLFLVLSGDRGLCGAFNANVNKAAEREWVKKKAELAGVEGATIEFATIGRKGREYLARRGATIANDFQKIYDGLTLEKSAQVSEYVVDRFKKAEIDSVYIIYNEFKSAITQKLTVEKLLPLSRGEPVAPDAPQLALLFEPTPKALLERLVPLYVEISIYRALLESQAGEFGARMSAMDSATRNAKEMIGRLTLVYNRARQAAITKELMEIIGGAEALKD